MEAHRPVSDPSVELEPTPSVKPLKLDIPDQAIEEAHKLLKQKIAWDDANDLIQFEVWRFVHKTFSKYPELRGVIANREEYDDNVKRQGEKEFIELVKDSLWRNPSHDLLHNDVFVKQISPKPSVSQRRPCEHVKAWNIPFRGDVADVLIQTISGYMDTHKTVYAREAGIVNSSGTGKSRAVDEVAKSIITVPMCIRRAGSHGFPPHDTKLRYWLTLYESDRVQALRKLHGFVYSLLTVTYNHLEDIASEWHGPAPLPTLFDGDIDDLSKAERDEQALLVKERQRMLAVVFRDRMTTGQSFSLENVYRRSFFKEVVGMATEFEKECVQASWTYDGLPSFQYKNEGVVEAGLKLSRFIDPKQLLNSGTRPYHPLVILYFDEAHILTEVPKNYTWTLFSELRRVLHELLNSPIFSLFISTSGTILSLSPVIQSPLRPIPEISFDVLAYPAMEDDLTLYQVMEPDWISHFGRPLFGSLYDALSEHSNDYEIMHFAMQKLLCGLRDFPGSTRFGSGGLACLSVRFALEFDFANEDARSVACKQIERHLRLCVAATAGFDTLITIAGSEPLLAEAATTLLGFTHESSARLLAGNYDRNCIDHGTRGELVAALLIMRARDMALNVRSFGWRSVYVTDFIKALLPDDEYKKLINSPPPHSQHANDSRTFEEIFKGYKMWFNHVIRIRDTDMINIRHLWKFITRGAMGMCVDNQRGVDIVLPICDPGKKISSRNVTAILVQVKNDPLFNECIREPLFDAMDPFQVGLFSDGDSPLPVIRMVFALASDTPGVSFPPTPEPRPDGGRFTGYDIWCAGLSEKTFKVIDTDVGSYKTLLTRSMKLHGAYEVDDSYMDQPTMDAKESMRRRLEPLVNIDDVYNHIHVSAQGE